MVWTTPKWKNVGITKLVHRLHRCYSIMESNYQGRFPNYTWWDDEIPNPKAVGCLWNEKKTHEQLPSNQDYNTYVDAVGLSLRAYHFERWTTVGFHFKENIDRIWRRRCSTPEKHLVIYLGCFVFSLCVRVRERDREREKPVCLFCTEIQGCLILLMNHIADHPLIWVCLI